MMRKKKFILAVFTLIVSVSMTGCAHSVQSKDYSQAEAVISENDESDVTDASGEAEDTDHAEPDEQISDAETETMCFVDAYGEEYETEIRPEIKKHAYDWTKLEQTDGNPAYEDESYISRRGIDVSAYQGEIDWERVKSSGITFAFLRIGYRGYGTEGKLCVDERFLDNLKGAQAAGVDVGVYFFSQAISEKEALEEAGFVLELLDGVSLQLPVVYDPERIRNDEARTDYVTGEQFTKNTFVFCQAIEAAGYEPMIYSNMVWEAFEYDLVQLDKLPVWYADYEAVPQTPYEFSFWQYSESGQVEGIEGNVDLNLQFCPK